MKHIPALDGLRAIAVLLVIAYHWGAIEAGWIGVQIFFVLSGFLITAILLSTKDRPFAPYIKRFYRRRALRIFPLYFGYVSLALALLLSANITNPPSQYWLSLYTYTLNLTRFAPAWNPTCAFAHLWSLSIEEQFYLVWPFAVYLLRPHALKRLIVALIVGCPLVRWLLGIYLLQSGRDAFTIGDTIYLFTLSQADAFAVGAAVAVFPQLMQLRRGMWFVRLMPWVALALGGISMLALRTTHTLLDHNPTNYWAGSSGGYFFPLWLGGQHVWGYTVLNLAAGALLLQIVRSSKPVPLLENRFLKYIGTISYGMYVFHYVLMAWFQLLINDATSIIGHVGIAAAYMGILILVAHLSYWYFERPFLRLKERTTTAAAAHTVSLG